MGKLLSGLWCGSPVIIDEGLMYLFICPVPSEEEKAIRRNGSLCWRSKGLSNPIPVSAVNLFSNHSASLLSTINPCIPRTDYYLMQAALPCKLNLNVLWNGFPEPFLNIVAKIPVMIITISSVYQIWFSCILKYNIWCKLYCVLSWVGVSENAGNTVLFSSILW